MDVVWSEGRMQTAVYGVRKGGRKGSRCGGCVGGRERRFHGWSTVT